MTTFLTKPTGALKQMYQLQRKESVVCPLCELSNDTPLAQCGYPGLAMQNVLCKSCGLIRINPRMTQEGYDEFYREHFFEYLNPYGRPAYVEEIEHTVDPRYATPTRKKLVPYILPFVPDGAKVLDIGAGFGQVLYILKEKKNIIPTGLEPDPESRAIAKGKMGIELDKRTVEEFFRATNDSYDMVVLNQTFEHLLSPLETLKAIARRLTKNGAVYIGVPNAYNPQMHMTLFYQLAHTYNYTPHTLKLFAQKAGLKVVSVRDPYAHPLEVILAHQNATWPEEDSSRVMQGSSWRDVKNRLMRKKILNITRGWAKAGIDTIVGKRVRESIRRAVDSFTRYKY